MGKVGRVLEDVGKGILDAIPIVGDIKRSVYDEPKMRKEQEAEMKKMEAKQAAEAKKLEENAAREDQKRKTEEEHSNMIAAAKRRQKITSGRYGGGTGRRSTFLSDAIESTGTLGGSTGKRKTLLG